MPVNDWMPEIKTNMETVHAAALAADEIATEGGVFGYNEWPGATLTLPSTLIGTIGGSQTYGVGSPAIAHHNVKIWVYVSMGISLASAQEMAFPFIERVRNQFAGQITLNAKVKHFLPPDPPALFYEGPGVIEYAGRQYAGIIFNYDLKENETGNFTPAA